MNSKPLEENVEKLPGSTISLVSESSWEVHRTVGQYNQSIHKPYIKRRSDDLLL